jgi:hypothetical protein
VASLTRLVGEILKISGREGLIAFPRIGQGNGSALAEMATRDMSRSWSEFVVRSNRKRSFKPLRELGRNWRSACMYTCTLKHWRHLNRPRRIRRLEQPEGLRTATRSHDPHGSRRTAEASSAAAVTASATAPPVSLLFDVDREYRARASSGDGSSRLSNTRLAHELGWTAGLVSSPEG